MKAIVHIASYPLSVIFLLLFGAILLIFDPIQRVCLRVFGYQAHKKSVDCFNALLVRSLHVLGTRFEITNKGSIPDNAPIIIVSNHQSLWDIPPILWFLRKYHPKFISKKELGKGIPSVSYNLKYGGSALIDRKKPKQAIGEMIKFANYLTTHNRSGVIFPEGTRSRNGIPKPFRRNGLRTLFEHAPNAYVLPITFNNSWKLQRFGMFPVPLGTTFEMLIHPVINVSEYSTEELIDTIEKTITAQIHTP